MTCDVGGMGSTPTRFRHLHCSLLVTQNVAPIQRFGTNSGRKYAF